MMEFLSGNKKYIFLFIIITVTLFVARVVFFANGFGGVEHDSGWYLGVAKNLAQRGIYASYTNTIVEEGVGAHSSIHGRFSVQDAQGFSYFPAGVTVGPGYVVPEALIIKIFGNGWWQYRLWPLLSYTGLLFILFLITWRFGGIASLLILQVWLWIVPQLTTEYAFEAYSEHTALFYLLLSFLLYYFASKNKKKYKLILFSGLFFSLSVLTKQLFLLAGVSFIAPLLWELWKCRQEKQLLFLRWGLFICGILLPIGLFELYRYLFLVSHFGILGWEAINQDLLLTFQSSGSGINGFNIFQLDWLFIQKKVNIWLDMAIVQPGLAWLVLLLSPLVVFKFTPRQFKLLVVMFYLVLIISFGWFVLISPTGWARHIWQGIVLGMMIISLALGQSLNFICRNLKLVPFYLVFIFIVLSIIRYDSIEINPFLDEKTLIHWRMNRHIRGLEGLPSHPNLSLVDQKDLVNFFTNHISPQDRIYYAGWFLNAEVSPLVDKVFYSLDRYFTLGQKNPEGGMSYLILGPYQQGPWSFEPPEYVPGKVSQLCFNIIYKNPSYLLCNLRQNLIPSNPAY